MALVGVDPGDDEHRQALRDRPADERLLGIEVEDIEFVDPRRHDEQRALIDLWRARLVLDELHQLIAVDDLAGRRRKVDAELERSCVRLANAQVAAAGLDVLGQHLQAPHQVLTALGERRAQKLRIGGEEVRRRQRRGDLTQIELRLLAIVRIEIVRPLDQIVRPARGQHIGLLDEIEIGIVAPRGVGEALVAQVGRDDRGRLFALEPLQGYGPEIDELLGQRRLRGERPLGIGHVIFGHPAEGTDHLAHFARERGLDLAARARLQVSGQHFAALLDRLGDVVRERLHIGWRVMDAVVDGLRGSSRRREGVPWRLRRREARCGSSGLGRNGRSLDFGWLSRLNRALRRSLRLQGKRRDSRFGGGRRLERRLFVSPRSAFRARRFDIRRRRIDFGAALGSACNRTSSRGLGWLRLRARPRLARTGLGHH